MGRRRFWIVASALVALPLIATASWRISSGDSEAVEESVNAEITGCTFSQNVAVVHFVIRNIGSNQKSVRVKWAFRGADGLVVANDSTAVTAPASGVVRGSQTTRIPKGVMGGTCNVEP